MGFKLRHPTAFLSRAIGEEPLAVAAVLAEQAAVWGRGRPIAELLDAYERAGAVRFARNARGLVDGEH
jgi:hypothetical protein